MPLLFEDGTRYSHGEVGYIYQPASDKEGSPRILVPVEFDGFATAAVIDTGGDFAICDPEIAEELGLDPSEAEDTKDLNVRGYKMKGLLYRLSIKFISLPGQSDITIESTVFVPYEHSAVLWKEMGLQSFIGMLRCLERLRIAIDPDKKMFYFADPVIDAQPI